MFNKGFLYQRLGTHLNLPSEPTEFKLSCRGGCAAKRHLAQQLVEQGELRVEPEQISGLVNATLEDKLGDRLPVSPIHVTAHNGLRGGAQCLRIGVQEVIFVFDHILHFSHYTRVQLG